jgi:secondary thiamine-phosphate synthase enzyme
MNTLNVQTSSRVELVDLSAGVKEVVTRSGVREGLCHVFVPHTTAGVTINEAADPDVRRDLVTALEALVPDQGQFRHAEGNSPAHVKATLVGSSVTVPVSSGQLALGTWQGLYFCEFDGPRTRKVHVTVVGA